MRDDKLADVPNSAKDSDETSAVRKRRRAAIAQIRDRLRQGKRKPLIEWALYLVFFVAILALLAGPHLLTALKSDSSGICIAISLLFIVGVVVNFFDIRYIDREMQRSDKHVTDMLSAPTYKEFMEASDESLLMSHLRNLYEIACKTPTVSQDNLIVLLQSKLNARISAVDILSSMLVTLGLVGTIVGLISSVGGIGTAMENTGGDNKTLLEGVNVALSGMGTAFYTTLLGAVFGGIVLRFLAALVGKHCDSLIAHIAELSEVYIIPSLRDAAAATDRRKKE